MHKSAQVRVKVKVKPGFAILHGPQMLSQLVSEYLSAAGWRQEDPQASSHEKTAGKAPTATPATVRLWLWEGQSQETEQLRAHAAGEGQERLLVMGQANRPGYPELEETLILAGAGGCLDEGEGLRNLQAAAEEVSKGNHSFRPAAYQRVIARLRAEIQENKAAEPEATSQSDTGHQRLTSREQEILQMLSRGLSNKEIANEMDLALSTVKAHVANLFKKYGVNSRLNLLLRAMGENGLVRMKG